ncbi:DNA endonuclease [Escherichia coli]|nr:DNA endonuclease [Escherichia coli]
MKKKTTLSEEDQALFRQLMAGTRKIKQDTIVHRPQRKKISEVPVKRLIQEQADASHYFSDEFQPLLNTEGPVKYVRPDVSHFEAKKLRRGDYSPELFLDLHGLTQLQAKQELGALIAACRREHVFCACVMPWAREAYFEAANATVAGATSACDGISPGTKRVWWRCGFVGAD